ncbi:MAG: hypothetical protein K8J31_31635, partial [Anaerolineae bacterium]|nr:hypothetical protein [Anaerolineae bacterium]
LRDVYLRFELEMPDWMRTFHREELYARAYRSYQPAPYEGRIHLFRATDRPDGDDFDEALGWGDIAGQGVEILHSPGAHGFMVRDPHAPVLAAQLRTSLDKAASKQQS